MKRRNPILSLIIVCLVANAAGAQEPREQWANKLFGSAAQRFHYFGVIPRGTLLHHDFEITNIYAEPLTITSVRASMGAASARTNKTILQPNEKTTIHIELDSRRFSGAKSQSVYVQLTVGSKYLSEATLIVFATSRDDLIVEPGEANFGSVAPGETPSSMVHVARKGKPDWKIDNLVVPKNAHFDATLIRSPERDAEVGYDVKVTIKKDAPLGRFFERIVLTSNDPEFKSLSLVVRGHVQPPLKVVPDALKLPEFKNGREKLVGSVRIVGAKKFRVVHVFGSDAVELGEQPSAIDPDLVRLWISPPPQVGPFKYTAYIMTDAHDEPLRIVIMGSTLEAAPLPKVAPVALPASPLPVLK